MFLNKLLRLTLIAALSLLTACASISRAPVTPGTVPDGRPVTQQQHMQGSQVRQALLQQFREDQSAANYSRVSRIVEKLAYAAGGNAVKSPWQLTILADDTVKNAAATSGNFIFVWTGMLKVVQDDHELATIIGHELAHVLALHTEPSFAEQIGVLIANGANIATQTALARAGVVGQPAGMAGGISSTIVKAAIVNPYSQKTELEADHIGLFLMARAGYNPKAAVRLWQRLSQDPDFTSNGALNFLSTHPSSNQRIDQLQLLLAQAEIVYQQSRNDSFSINRKSPLVAKASDQSASSTNKQIASKDSSQIQTKQASSPTVTAPTANTTQGLNKNNNTYVSKLDLWRTVKKTPVYTNDSENSGIVSELSENTELIIKHDLKDWIEIKSPISGFIPKRAVKPSWSIR